MERDRMAIVAEALEGQEFPRIVSTPDGTVELTGIRVVEDCVELSVADPVGGDPSFRIINPPTRTHDGRTDPVAALAESVAMFGGASTRRERR